jgi:phospholipase/carboxylesterase
MFLRATGFQSRLRTAIVCLLCGVIVSLTAAAQTPVKVQAAQRAFEEAYRQEDWKRAVERGIELARMVPDRPLVQYNLACVLALSGDDEAALDWLGRAAASGFSRLTFLESDSDLDSLRDLPGYASVRDEIAENQRRQRNDVLKIAASNPPLVVVPDDGRDAERRPLIVALHGYGDNPANYPALWGPAAKDIGAIVAVPQGAQAVGEGRGWGDVDEADAILQLALAHVREHYEVDWDRVVLTGFSQGGFIAMALGIRHPHLFIGVIPMAGVYLPEVDALPPARDGDPRYYFLVGTRDRAFDEVRRAATDFEAEGYDIELRTIAGLGHSFPHATKRELEKALRFVLGE